MAKLRFQLSRLVPMPMTTTIGESRADGAYLVGVSWWQWRDRVWAVKETAVRIP